MLLAGMTLDEAAAEIRSRMLAEALKQQRGNICRVARQLHAHRNTISRDLHHSSHSAQLLQTLRQIRQENDGSRFARRAMRENAGLRKHVHPALGGVISDSDKAA
jgi:IS30 family transposase